MEDIIVQWFREDDVFIIRLDDGDHVTTALKDILGEDDVPPVLVAVSAVGMIKSVEIGYFTGDTYRITSFEQPCEVLSLSGIALKDPHLPLHMHISINPPGGNAVGGHLFRGTVVNTLELCCLGIKAQLKRKKKGVLRILDFPE